MIMRKLKYLILNSCFAYTMLSWERGFLDTLPSTTIAQPQTLDDFQRLLDNPRYIGISPSLPQLACDDYYFTSKIAWEVTRHATERNRYIWVAAVLGGEEIGRASSRERGCQYV